jgi:ribose 5-phosphate isomerase B
MSDSRAVLIASDHAGVAFKAKIQNLLSHWRWLDLGTHTADRVDYTDYAAELGRKVVQGHEASRGILICGTGIGMCIAANKIAGIRAALADNPVAAQLSREHNHANVLCLGARIIAPEYGADIVHVWLSTQPSSEERHLSRIKKIQILEKDSSS